MVLWHWVPYWWVPQEGGWSWERERWTQEAQEEGAQEEGTQEEEVWEEGGGSSGGGRMDTVLAGHTHQSLFQCKYSGLWSKKRKRQQEWVEGGLVCPQQDTRITLLSHLLHLPLVASTVKGVGFVDNRCASAIFKELYIETQTMCTRVSIPCTVWIPE